MMSYIILLIHYLFNPASYKIYLIVSFLLALPFLRDLPKPQSHAYHLSALKLSQIQRVKRRNGLVSKQLSDVQCTCHDDGLKAMSSIPLPIPSPFICVHLFINKESMHVQLGVQYMQGFCRDSRINV